MGIAPSNNRQEVVLRNGEVHDGKESSTTTDSETESEHASSPGGASKADQRSCSESDKRPNDTFNYLDSYAEEDGFPRPQPREALTWSVFESRDITSDWTIEVCWEDVVDIPTTPYHVHRNIIALGERRCGRLADDILHSDKKTSRIFLNYGKRLLLGSLLDFVYDGTTSFIHTRSALPLRTLAQDLQCQALVSRVVEFIEEDIHRNDDRMNALFYLREAARVKNDHVFTLALSACARLFNEIGVIELCDLPIDLFRAIITHPDLELCDCPPCKKLTNRKVSCYLKAHEESVSPSFLIEVTDSAILGDSIDPELLDHFQELVQKVEPSATEQERKGLQDLCFRCWAQQNLASVLPAREYLHENWGSLDWKGRELIDRLQTRRRVATIKSVLLNLDLDKNEFEKRKLETEIVVLRRTKRRLLSRDRSDSISYESSDSEVMI